GPAPLPIGGRASGIHFQVNEGEFLAVEKGASLSEVLFKVPASGGDLYVTTSGLSYVFYRLKGKAVRPPAVMPGDRHIHRVPKKLPGPEDDIHYEVERVD